MLNDIKLIAQSAIRIVNEGGKVIYFDPYELGDDYKNDADYIFITHTHYDHLSLEDLIKIKREDTIIIGPNDIVDKVSNLFDIQNIIFVEPNKTYKCDDINFETVPAYNIDKLFHKKEYNLVGYIATIDGIRVYVAGDTDNIPEIRNISCDVACVPIGGTYTMDKTEASKLIRSIKPKVAIPIHYKTIVGSVEDAYDFKEELSDIVDVKILME